MTLNMPKWNQMSWKKSKISQTFAKSLAVMHVSVRHMLQHESSVKNAKNIKEALFWPIFLKLLSHAFWHPIIYAPNYMPNDISHKVT